MATRKEDIGLSLYIKLDVFYPVQSTTECCALTLPSAFADLSLFPSHRCQVVLHPFRSAGRTSSWEGSIGVNCYFSLGNPLIPLHDYWFSLCPRTARYCRQINNWIIRNHGNISLMMNETTGQIGKQMQFARNRSIRYTERNTVQLILTILISTFPPISARAPSLPERIGSVSLAQLNGWHFIGIIIEKLFGSN